MMATIMPITTNTMIAICIQIQADGMSSAKRMATGTAAAAPMLVYAR